MSRTFAPEYGPRGLKGAETVRQGFVDVNAVIDRDEIETRIADNRTNKVDARLKARTEDEWDIGYNEFLLTPIVHGYGDRDEVHDIPVTSTVAGIKGKNVHNVLDKYQPAGLSMTRIVYKPENASVVAPQRKLASQMKGTWTADSYHRDMPFGALIRLEPNQKPQNSHGYLGTNKLRLVPVPELDGKPFAARAQERMYNYFNNPMLIDDDENKSKVDLTLEDMFEAFTDVIGLSMAMYVDVLDVAAREYGVVDVDDFRVAILNLHADKKRSANVRRLMMQHMFAGMNANVKSANPDLLYGGRGLQSTQTIVGKIQKIQLESCAKLFEKLMDAIRVDNIWTVGKVIRPTQSPGKFDGMFI